MTIEEDIIKAVRGISRYQKPKRKDVIDYLARQNTNTETINRTFRKMINEYKTLIEYSYLGSRYLLIPTKQLSKEPLGNLEDFFNSNSYQEEQRTHTRELSE